MSFCSKFNKPIFILLPLLFKSLDSSIHIYSKRNNNVKSNNNTEVVKRYKVQSKYFSSILDINELLNNNEPIIDNH